jgi:hypothetical protein
MMASRGYDDTGAIKRIEELYATGRYPSRRAAIIEVVGVGGLRRIEKKMSRLEESPALRTEVAVEGAENEGQAALLMHERQMLDKSGETIRWSAFSDPGIVQDRLAAGYESSVLPDQIAQSIRSKFFLRRVSSISAMTCLSSMFGAMLLVLFRDLAEGMESAASWWIAREIAKYASITLGIVSAFAFINSVCSSAGLLGGDSHIDRLREQFEVGSRLRWARSEKLGLSRYILTDRAFYALSLKGGSVHIDRLSIKQLRCLETKENGDLVLECGGSRITIAEIRDADELAAILRPSAA